MPAAAVGYGTGLQEGEVAVSDPGEAMPALHGLKDLTTCADEHGWAKACY
ncbi:hypothetical protein [Streptomyces nigrescens]